jgi:hypothetical protein
MSNFFQIINLTPHAIVIFDDDGETSADFPPSGIIARAAETSVLVGNVNGVPTKRKTFGEVTDLPEPTPNTYLVVSALAGLAAKAGGRDCADLLLTADPVRDEGGRIIGCRSFALV